jgi:hypothetical protein
LQVVSLVHMTEAALVDAAAASHLELQQPAAPRGRSSNTSSPPPFAAAGGQQPAELVVHVHVLLAFQPYLGSRVGKAFAAPEHWVVLWSCHGLAAALGADPSGCQPASAASIAQKAYAAALDASSAQAVERYGQQGGHPLVFKDLLQLPAANASAEDVLVQFLRSAGPTFSNVTAAQRDVVSFVPSLTWRGRQQQAGDQGRSNGSGRGVGRKVVLPKEMFAIKVPSVAACMEWVGLASLRDVPWIQFPAAA